MYSEERDRDRKEIQVSSGSVCVWERETVKEIETIPKRMLWNVVNLCVVSRKGSYCCCVALLWHYVALRFVALRCACFVFFFSFLKVCIWVVQTKWKYILYYTNIYIKKYEWIIIYVLEDCLNCFWCCISVFYGTIYKILLENSMSNNPLTINGWFL